MVNVRRLEQNPMLFFDQFHTAGEIIFDRSAAITVCENAIDKRIWILGVDVGTLQEDGKYLEDFNEGWLSKLKLMGPVTTGAFHKGLVTHSDLSKNNLGASAAVREVPSRFNAFILTGKRVELKSANCV